MTALPERFWAKVEKTDTCWLWTACTNSRGYGCFGVEGKSQLAHRVSYTVLVGPIPDGLTLDHLIESGICSSKLCVRPDHLEPVTDVENVQRAARSITTCSEGHPLTLKPGDRQRRCRPCEARKKRERLRARELIAA